MTFSETTIQLSRGALPCRVAGTGPIVIYLHGADGPRISEPMQALCESYKVIVPTLPPSEGTPRSQLAELVAELIARVADDKVDVIGHGSGARVAAWLAARHSDKLDALILVAPEDFGRPAVDDALEAELAKIGCLTLILAGNVDSRVSPDSVRLLKQKVPRAFLVYVHDAGHDIETDRPKQFLRVVSDFLHWGEGFLVRRNAA